MSAIYFCSFADLNYQKSLKRIGKQAKEIGVFSDIFLYNENNLPEYAFKRCLAIIEQSGTRKGFGYYSWKPAVILDVLKKINYSDILIYTDAGSHINSKGKEKLFQYIEQTKKNDILITQLTPDYNDYKYTKMDTIEMFKKKLPNTEILKTGQIQGGNVFLLKNDYTLSLIEQYDKMMSVENIHFFDDSESQKPNYCDFVENRHDQSIFSLLLKCNHYGVIQGEFYAPNEEGWIQLEKTEPILNKRDKEFKQYLKFKDKLALLYRKVKTFFKK